jgi:predicted kinase
MDRRFVVVSGVPGSGKSTVGREVAARLGLPLLDKDAILEGLFASKGVGDVAWRRALSRESDVLLQREAEASPAAVLVSHWRLAGMAANSGTPAEWISALSKHVVSVHCECPVDVAAERFANRARHAGHLDGERSRAEIVASIRESAGFGRLEIGPLIEVDTSGGVDWDGVLREIHRAFLDKM